MQDTSTDFVLRGGDAAFANRQKLLFDQLSSVERKCNKREISETDDTEMETDGYGSSTLTDDRKQKRETKRFRGKESIFKRPEGPAPRTSFRNIPDYHRNPHKWVKYTLDDVSNEDMTDRSNTQAAMSFLRELKARRKREEVDDCDEIMDVDLDWPDSIEVKLKSKDRVFTSTVVFRKPQVKEEAESSGVIATKSDKTIFRSSKIILPEYVVGQKPKKTSKQNRPIVKVDRVKELRLDHLQEPDEEKDD